MSRVGLPEDRVRWIIDDALKFVQREARRGRFYDGILMDPPSYGRGPGGEVWKLENELYGLAELCAQAQGYIYYVTYAGVTGAAHLDVGDAGRHLAQVRAVSKVPVYAGFGIRDAGSAAAMAAHADGVVVGSALVSAMEDAADPADATARAGGFLRPLRQALDASAGNPA